MATYLSKQGRRASAGLALCAAAIALLSLAPGAMASKRVSSFIGSPTGAGGTIGGLFDGSIADIAINQTGAGGVPAGEVYVVDTSNLRVQEFSPSGAFVRAWGEDVIEAGAPNDTGLGFEICDTTAAMPNVASDCKAGTSGTGAGGSMLSPRSIAVDQGTGAVYVGDESLRRVQKFSANGAFLAALGWDVQIGGVTSYEVCTTAASCQAGVGGENAGQVSAFAGPSALALAVGPSGDLYVAEAPKRRIQQFKSDGTFVSAWGWNVVPSGQVGDSGASYERCPAAAASAPGACRSGDHSANDAPGHFGRIIEDSPRSIAVNSAGEVYASDLYGSDSNRAERRILSFDANGGSPSVFLDSADPSNPFLEAEEFSESFDVAENLLAFGPSDHLFVRGVCGPLSCLDLPEGADREQRIFEFDSSGALLDSHLRKANLQVGGIAVNRSTGDIYAIGAGGGFNRVFILDDDGAPPAPTAVVAAPIELGAHVATFKGTVNPNGPVGIPTSYRFEYSRDGTTWNSVTGDPLAPADGVGAQEVSAKVSDLEANATYRVRLSAVKAFGASDEVTSPELTFLTDGPSPEVTTLQAQNFSDVGAVLSGTVNPNNRATKYRFEYGETDDYGAHVPLSEGLLEGGIVRYVSAQAQGLTPDTTYHFRLVAESEAGVAEGADRTFTTRSAFGGFAQRAFEQISPHLKEGDAQFGTGILFGGRSAPPGPASADGNHMAFTIWGTVDSAEWGGDRLSRVLAHRTAAGWQLDDVSPRPLFPSAGVSGASLGGFGLGDLSRQLIFAQNAMREGDPGIYLRDSNADQTTSIANFDSSVSAAMAVTPDLDHLAFATLAMLTPEPGLPGDDKTKVFEWHGGELRLVSAQSDETPFAAASQLGSGAGANSEAESVLNAMSADGRHVFFTTPYGPSAPEATIYRRDQGEETILVSPSQRTPADPQGPQAKLYLDATRDQSATGAAAVFFASKEKLTDAATNTGPASSGLGDLYRYQVNTDTLTNLSAETNDAAGARVLGMLGRSEDGDRVYYVASGRVLPGQGVEGRPNLYAWHDDGSAAGETRFVATLGNSVCEPRFVNDNNGFPVGGDSCNWTSEPKGTAGYRTSRVSPDGKRLLFQSDDSLTGYPGNGANEVYLYEAEAGGSGYLSCLSCDPDGTPGAADADLAPQGGSTAWMGTFGQDPVRSMSADGGKVFFTSPASLLPADTNGKRDVYGWSEGHLELISTGKSSDDSRFDNASADGSTVFLTTRQQLVGVDDDGFVDVYAARIGGGFDFQNPPPPGIPCVGDGCKPVPTPQPAPPSVGSSGLPGPGNQAPVKKKPHKKKQKKKKNAKKHKKGHGKAHGRNGKSQHRGDRNG
ncbi:MAG TPA: hypothetical protein VEW07_09145 [Solirubrobacterales bacterium]|nr:hypothetical protein [Solirubrobacterales bacterium]